MEFVEKNKPTPEPVDGISFCISTNAGQVEKTKLEISSIHKTMEGVDIPYEIVVAGVVSPFKETKGLKLVDTPEDASQGMLAKLRNNAGEVVQYDTLVFVDDDFLFPDTWAKRLLEFSKESGWKVLGNKILLPSGGRFWDRATMNPHKLVPYDFPEFSRQLYQTGGFWIIRKDTYEENKWDSTIPINAAEKGINKHNEDIDLSMRIISKNIPLSFDENNTVWHWDESYVEWQDLTLKKDIIVKQYGPIYDDIPLDNDFEILLRGVS